MKSKEYILSLLLAVSLTGGLTMPAFAAGPGAEDDPYKGYDAATWERLNDNKIEYDELEDLIGEFSPTMKTQNLMMDDSINYMKFAASDSLGLSQKFKDEADSIKAGGNMADPGTQAAYAEAYANAMMYKTMGNRMNDSVKGMEKENSSISRTKEKTKKSLANAVRSMMIGYHSMDAQITMLTKLEETSSSMYQATLLQQQLGLATPNDVISAQTSLLSTQNQLAALKSSKDSIYKNICMISGLSSDGQIEIGPVPPADLEWISSRNREEDKLKAIGNNSEVIDQRHSKANSSSKSANKQRLEEEAEEKVKIAMEGLYQEMIQSKAAYESANTAYQSAILSKNAADRQYQLGMLSKIQYLSQQFSFLQAEANYKTAELTLVGAMITYQQGIDGSLTIE